MSLSSVHCASSSGNCVLLKKISSAFFNVDSKKNSVRFLPESEATFSMKCKFDSLTRIVIVRVMSLSSVKCFILKLSPTMNFLYLRCQYIFVYTLYIRSSLGLVNFLKFVSIILEDRVYFVMLLLIKRRYASGHG